MPPNTPALASAPASHSNSSSDASALTEPPNAQSSHGSQGARGSSPLPSTSAVDLAGKRLREQQLQDRFKAAQGFIERTVGQHLASSDLHESLKDGVILCRLANRLRPGTVEQISLKNLPFVKMENISNFLNAAKQLGVQSSDLFQTVDLYEGKDMNQVVSTILTLERVVGGVARMSTKDKRPGPSPITPTGSTPSDITKTGALRPPVITRMRSKTAHAPSVASTTASIRPSSAAYYAAQVRKLEEDSIRFANGYDHHETGVLNSNDHRHQSTPVANKIVPPPLPTPLHHREKISHRPSQEDIEAGVENMSFGSEDLDLKDLNEAEHRRAQRDLVFGGPSSSLPSEQSSSGLTIPKSVSGPILSVESSTSALDMSRRKKKSISLDPQAANAVMGNTRYRDGLASPSSPGVLTQSASYSAISNLHSPGLNGTSNLINLKQHTRYSSERTLDGNSRTTLVSPTSSRSTTPVQGLRKSTNSVEPLREKLELWENDSLAATFQLGNCIGRGQFGAVYKALNLVTGQMVAVKRIKIDGLKDVERDLLMQEVDLLKSLAHPSIVKYEGFIKSYGYLNIILEYVENGSLLTTLKSFGTFPEKLVVAYVVKILEGLVYLHGKEVVHCDLKAANILTTKNGNVKLSDFGVSLNLKVKESDFGAVAGTPNWMAPEVIELKGASPASDIWSLGCTIIEMLTGRPPYADLLAMTTLFRIVEDERPPLPNNLSMDLLDFLCQCFQKDPILRPSAGALGRHVWIKRNFASKELKPMDSLPYMKRKSLEPREKFRPASALEEDTTTTTASMTASATAAAKRASTPSGLSSGAPPPSLSAAGLSLHRRSTRRGSVDSASGFYASSTVPAPTDLSTEKYQDVDRQAKAGNHHQFVKSSFAKPVECRLCHDSVRKQAVICQDCSMVFHRKCQFFVGETCFPSPHLSFFQPPSPAQSAPNLKLLTTNINGKAKGCSRPSSRTSVLNLEGDRSRSVTPSQNGRPCATPPLTQLPKRESTLINERAEQRRMMSSPPPPLSLSSQRVMSPEGFLDQNDSNHQQMHSRVSRPSSRQSDNSPTTPTTPTALSNLRNLISGPKRFSFGTKKNAFSPSVPHPLPTPPTSYTPTPPKSSLSIQMRQHAGTPDSGKVSINGHADGQHSQQQHQQQQQQHHHHQYSQQGWQIPGKSTDTPLKSIPVPILSSSHNHHNRERKDTFEDGVGSLNLYDDDDSNYGRGHQRPSSINLFSTSAPPVHAEYRMGLGNRVRSKVQLGSSYHQGRYLEEEDDDDEDEDEGENERDLRADNQQQDQTEETHEINDQEVEALLVPSAIRRPRSNSSMETRGYQGMMMNHGRSSGNHGVVPGVGYGRVKSQSISQTIGQQQQQQNMSTKMSFGLGERDSEGFGSGSSSSGSNNNRLSSSSSISFGPTFNSGRTGVNNLQHPPSQAGGGRTRMLNTNGYQSSGSSSAAMASSYSSHSNNSSSASSLGSVAALLEEEERMMKELKQQQQQQNHQHGQNRQSKNGMQLGVPSMYSQMGSQPARESHRVGIKTMLSRFSASSSKDNAQHSSAHVKTKDMDQQSASKVAASTRHQIPTPVQYQHQHSQPPTGVRSVHPQEKCADSVGESKPEMFARGYETQLHRHTSQGTNGNDYAVNGNSSIASTTTTTAAATTSGWRSSSALGFGTGKESTALEENVSIPLSSSAASALRRGGKVIRKSMGMGIAMNMASGAGAGSSVEKDRWE
ncbi:hypothetical protein BG011_004765 [Mortierella polycephala]|uniref:Uncharacterized protein n=1 Tax=Mortierella polycephala TaxID=41804 RepID=A0A9P6Q0M7_9FUNG|nr:hypothetical protein BG011_004765 [Mortierella polycephala]